MKKITCAVLTVLSTCVFINVTYADDDGFSFDDLEAVEASEQQTLLQMAKEAANNYDFSKAQSLIEQAQNKTYAPDDVDSAKQVLASARDRKQREDAEKARLAEEKRQRELAAQRQQQPSGGYSGTSSGGTVGSVIVQGDATSGLFGTTLVKSINLSGGSGYYDKNNSLSSISISKGYGGKIAGRYNYSIRLYNGVNKICSGSVYIDGRHKWVTINVMADSCSANVYQH